MHSKTWQDKAECAVCHKAGSAPPKYPSNHAASWNCYLCHQTALMGCATREPHSHAYTAPDQCVQCHQQGTFTYGGCAGGHNFGQNCITCHGATHHGKTFQNADQCKVCHQND
jgi:hypothetical protein